MMDILLAPVSLLRGDNYTGSEGAPQNAKLEFRG